MNKNPCATCGAVHLRCVGHNGSGAPCGNWPIRGATICHKHGGSARHIKEAARRRVEAQVAERAVVTYGLPREIDPTQALLEELYRTAGHVGYLGALVADLQEGDLKQLDAEGKFEKASVWVEMYWKERGHFAKVAKLAIDAGIEERRVKMAEAQGEQLSQVIRDVLGDVFGLFAAAGVAAEVVRRIQREQAPDLVRQRLMQMAELSP
jgi:hypothetical protein